MSRQAIIASWCNAVVPLMQSLTGLGNLMLDVECDKGMLWSCSSLLLLIHYLPALSNLLLRPVDWD